MPVSKFQRTIIFYLILAITTVATMQIPLQLRIVTDEAAASKLTQCATATAGMPASCPTDLSKLAVTSTLNEPNDDSKDSHTISEHERIRCYERQPLTSSTDTSDNGHSSVSESLEQYITDRDMSSVRLAHIRWLAMQ
jgi:hypothetical protein